MDAETSQALIAQLRWIKILLAVLSVLLLVVTAIMVVDYWRRWYGAGRGPADARKFYAKAGLLITEGSYPEAHALAAKRMSEKPDDPLGYWFAALALYKQDKPAEALPLFRKVVDTAPGWSERVEPYLERCEAEAKEQKPSE